MATKAPAAPAEPTEPTLDDVVKAAEQEGKTVVEVTERHVRIDN